jgi:hypothetical protein
MNMFETLFDSQLPVLRELLVLGADQQVCGVLLEGFEDEALAISELKLTISGDLDIANFLELKVQLIRSGNFHFFAHRHKLPFPEIFDKYGFIQNLVASEKFLSKRVEYLIIV